MKSVLILFVIFLQSAVHSQPMVKVEVSSDTISVGETVEITYTIENGEGKFNMPDMHELPIISGPNSSSSFMYQNGKMSSTQSYSFTLMATAPGILLVPGTTYQNAGEEVAIQPVEIVVAGDRKNPNTPKNVNKTPDTKPAREKKKF